MRTRVHFGDTRSRLVRAGRRAWVDSLARRGIIDLSPPTPSDAALVEQLIETEGFHELRSDASRSSSTGKRR